MAQTSQLLVLSNFAHNRQSLYFSSCIDKSKAEGISSMTINGWVEEYNSLKEKFPFIKCQCGKEILLLPDSKAMDKAIEYHVAEHMRKQPAPVKAEEEAKRISELLIKQALKKASEM